MHALISCQGLRPPLNEFYDEFLMWELVLCAQVDLPAEYLLPSLQPGVIPGARQHQRPDLLHWKHDEAGRCHHLLGPRLQEPHPTHERRRISNRHSGNVLVLASKAGA